MEAPSHSRRAKPYHRPRLRAMGTMSHVTRKSGPVQFDNVQHPTRQN